MEISFRKVTHLLIYYLLPLALLVVSIARPQRGFFFEVGEFALYSLILVMFIKPLYVLIPWHFLRKVGTYRREIGLLTFWLFLFHAVGLIYLSDLFSLSDFSGWGNGLFWGAVAGICMIILGVTSNNISTRVLGGNWKRVQYLAYPAFIAALVHAGMASGELTQKLVIAGTYVVLKGAEFWKSKHEVSGT